jgi:AraC-like DNA-binding protein
MSTDVLSEVLRAVRLSGAVFFTVDGASPWVAEAPAGSVIGPLVMPGAEHVIEYHVVAKGMCYGALIDGPPVRLDAGDVIVFPHGDSHIMASAPGMRGPVHLESFRRPDGARLPIAMSLNPGGKLDSQIVCGFLGCDARPFNPLLATLPRLIHVPKSAALTGGTVSALIQLAVAESAARRPGSESMLARLSELFFIEVVRHHLATLPSDTIGWLAGLRDDAIGRTLSLLHDRPAHPWSLDELAKEAGLSRSVLAERFHHFVGTPPMQYLAQWRMQLAASLLTGTSATIAEVADRVGYGSEAALSRAFKRLVGVTPSAWREGTRPNASFAPAAPEDDTGNVA